ncbi:SnoaL-like polyketide cyclase [Streptomyces tateyamensis]|uniref:SnoaL-like polyketide cyclase n=1 Tax=Streptomyces tateyamensis TaxID=565073 RepID=A0A2V4NHX3_9ACTN|nr:nuclear transport factor 2 family protein [Streptomyces tateyamensis]PYC65897.1 SnoaL-like polyketide cyclase [Streptomyces tateyamensis]
MAEHPHAALVRKGYDAFSRGDTVALRSIMTADCTQHVPGSSPMSGDFKGVEAVLGYYGQLAAETNGTFRVELEHLFVDGRGHVMSVHRFTAERAGRRVDMTGGIMFRIVGEKITDLDECVEDIAAVDEFWA